MGQKLTLNMMEVIGMMMNRKKRDRKRDEFLKGQGFKIIRMESKRSIPSWEQIEDEINYLMEKPERKFAHLCIDNINN